jgi:hypothetical protein
VRADVRRWLWEESHQTLSDALLDWLTMQWIETEGRFLFDAAVIPRTSTGSCPLQHFQMPIFCCSRTSPKIPRTTVGPRPLQQLPLYFKSVAKPPVEVESSNKKRMSDSLVLPVKSASLSGKKYITISEYIMIYVKSITLDFLIFLRIRFRA